MATTFTLALRSKSNPGDEREVRWTLDVTNYEQADNVPLTVAQLGLNRLTHLEVQSIENTLIGIWDGSTDNPVITLFNVSDGLEAADATDHGQFVLTARGK